MHISAISNRPAFAHDSAIAAARADFAGSAYNMVRDDRARPNWIVLGLIALAHVVALALVIEYDVILPRHKVAPLVLHIVPVDIVPPPLRAEPPRPQPKTIEPPIVAPPPLVTTPTPPPQVVVTEAPPPQPVVHTAPPAPPARPMVTAPTGPVEIGRMTVMPGNPPLKYPTSARMKHEEGVVRLRIVVATDGHVEDISLDKSSGFDSLDKSAMDVVRHWRFVPPTRDGIAVEGIGIFPATFTLA